MSDLLKDTKVVYDVIDVEVAFREKIQGGVPKSKDVATKWSEIKGLTPEQVTEIEQNGVEPGEVSESITIGFMSDDVGLYVKDINWKAHLKDMLSRLGIFKSERGSKNEVLFGMYIRPERVRFYRDDSIVTKVDGIDEQVAHITGASGRMSVLKRAEYVEKVTSNFKVYILQPYSKLDKTDIVKAFVAGQEYGTGANRSIGFGRYNIIRMEDAGKVETTIGKLID